eukprot:GILI01062795.1.p1 GENE.GILI01062795.1~~GILI01062795.1.p1  ORF type:complete len:102 (+),score=7.55 GILI01062795.1:36-341(+)
MFGARPQGSGKNWSDMFFHQKLVHLIDHGADFIVDKSKFWVPCVGAAMGLSIMLFGGENGLGDLFSLAVPVIMPSAQQSTFGQQMPQRGPEGPEGLDEEEL